MVMSQDQWKACSNCKKPILFNQVYFICSVSTCNQKRTGWTFCTVECWDTHIPKMNHKECWAIEKKSPKSLSDVPQTAPKDSERKSEDTKENKPGQGKTVVIRRPGTTG